MRVVGVQKRWKNYDPGIGIKEPSYIVMLIRLRM